MDASIQCTGTHRITGLIASSDDTGKHFIESGVLTNYLIKTIPRGERPSGTTRWERIKKANEVIRNFLPGEQTIGYHP